MIPRFRAWDNKRKLMIDEVVVIDLYHEYIGYLYPSEIVQGEIVSRLPINDVIIMQSTGLYDKNGVEIFEGDVLGGIYDESYINYCYVCKQFTLHDNFGGNDYCYQCEGDIFWHELANDKNLEVISNIYENQELEVEE